MALEYDYLSTGKHTTLVVVAVMSCMLSLYGSSTIIYLVLLKRWKKTQDSNSASIARRRSSLSDDDGLYHRIVFGLSVTDLITSLATMISPFTTRSDTNIPFAIGNDWTCEWSAFFFYFWLASFLYSAELSLFFLLTVRYNMREHEISRRFEPYLHIVPFLVSIASGSAGLALDLFNPDLLLGSCDLFPYPAGCDLDDNVECDRGLMHEMLGLWYLFVAVCAFIVGLVSTWLLYRTVQKQTLRNRRFSLTGEVNEQQRRRTRAVAMQAIWYTAAFMNIFLSILLACIVEEVYYTEDLTDTKRQLSDSAALFTLNFLVCLFFPLQGFFNWYIYIRPRLIRWKDANPENSWLWSYRMVLTGNLTPTTRRTTHLAAKARFHDQQHQQHNQAQTPHDEGEFGRASHATAATAVSSVQERSCVESCSTSTRIEETSSKSSPTSLLTSPGSHRIQRHHQLEDSPIIVSDRGALCHGQDKGDPMEGSTTQATLTERAEDEDEIVGETSHKV